MNPLPTLSYLDRCTPNDLGYLILAEINRDQPNFQAIHMILEVGGDINFSDSCQFDETPLYYAAQCGHVDLCAFLLDHGADINRQTDEGWSALHISSNDGYLEIVKLLVARGAEVNLQTAGGCGWSPLSRAGINGHLEIVEFLLDNGANISELIGFNKNTLLHNAAHNGALGFAELLLKLGVDPIARNTYGETPLHIAAYMGNVNICRLLITHGVSVNHLDVDGCFALHWAAHRGHLDICKLLVEHGSILNQENIKGWAPLDMAMRASHQATAKYLRSILETPLISKDLAIPFNNDCPLL